jgi:hypothetical protein
VINRHGLACFKPWFTLVQVGLSGLDGRSLVDELTPLLHGFTFDVVL